MQLLHQHKVDLIFLDVQMPSMTGIDCFIKGAQRALALIQPAAATPKEESDFIFVKQNRKAN